MIFKNARMIQRWSKWEPQWIIFWFANELHCSFNEFIECGCCFRLPSI